LKKKKKNPRYRVQKQGLLSNKSICLPSTSQEEKLINFFNSKGSVESPELNLNTDPDDDFWYQHGQNFYSPLK